MKKQILKLGVFVLPVVFGWGCISGSIEEEPKIESIANFKVIGKSLSFDSFESYENSIQNPESITKTPFTSLARLVSNEELNVNKRVLSDEQTFALKEYENSLILDILDEDGMVVIDGKLFYLDFVNKVALVTSNLDLRESLKDIQNGSDEVFIFSFEDDIIGLLEEGSTGTISSLSQSITENNRVNVFVGDNCDWDECRYNNNVDGDTGYEYRVEAKHVYQSSGIYFKLFSQAKHMKRQSPPIYSAEDTDITISWDYWYKSKKNSIGTRYDIGTRSKWDNVFEIQHYASSRGLEKYRLDSEFYVEVGGDHGSGIGGFTYWSFELFRISKGM
ncbi:hypothetical protein [Algoriphagus sp. PAP.12]|uniref:hypothetical protein n=1 Tax=Algoriphagus sp. PAP.12 TaxID=2996678 RepID=UPI00227B6622|nr:hypothetical protein [Algoriphagus sp. PAP.12]